MSLVSMVQDQISGSTLLKLSTVDFIKQVIDNISNQIVSLDTELEQACKGHSGHVKSLFECFHTIKTQTEKANAIFQDIHSDKESLVRAISRTDVTGETFRNIQKLEATVQELEKELKEGAYDYFSLITCLLIDTHKQMSQFEAYVALPYIASIKQRIVCVEDELYRQIRWIFRDIGPLVISNLTSEDVIISSEISIDLSALPKIAVTVDALGETFRGDLLSGFAQLQLMPYEQAFKLGSNNTGLEYIKQRFDWFKSLLTVVKDRFSGVFPVEWNVSSYLYSEFVRRTFKHMSDVLSQMTKNITNPEEHIASVLKALKSLARFEASFDRPVNGVLISDAFDPFLGPYVQMERQELDKIMTTALTEDSVTEDAQVGEPFQSFHKVFSSIKIALERCAGLSAGNAYLSLTSEFRSCLSLYADKLKNRCAVAVTRNQPSLKLEQQSPSVIRQQMKTFETTLCRIIRTAEHCVDTLPALESSIKSRVKPVYAKDVTFSPQIDGFSDLVSHVMTLLVSDVVTTRMDEDFRTMRHVKWRATNDVGDVSPHIKNFLATLSDCIPRIRAALTPVYFNNFCIKLASAFLDAFHANLKLLKRVCTIGGGQLLVDLNGLKEFLLKMPNVRLPEGADPVVISKVYLSVVTAKAKRIEIILKLLCVEDDKLEEMFPELWPEGTAADLSSVRSMRSVRNVLPVPLPLDQFHDATKISKRAADKVGDSVKLNLNKGLSRVDSGFRTVVSDLTQLVHDTSTHSSDNESNKHSGFKKTTTTDSTNTSAKPVSDVASRAVDEIKNKWSDAMAFVKKSGAAGGGGGVAGKPSSTASSAPQPTKSGLAHK